MRSIQTLRSLLSKPLVCRWKIHVLQRIYVVLLNQSNIFLLEFARHGRVFLGVASRVIELVWTTGWSIHRIVVDYHIICAILETHSLLILI